MTKRTYLTFKEHCLKQEACHTCTKGFECAELFSAYKPKDFVLKDGKIVLSKANIVGLPTSI